MANTGIISWSTTEASNATADSTINMAEGMAPSAVNNSVRALMARLAEHYADTCGTKITSGGSSNAYTVTANQTWDTYADGMRVAFIANHTNTGASTLNVDGIGAKALRALTATALQAGAILAGMVYEAVYDAGGDEFLLINTPPLFASQALMEAATSASSIVSPARQHFHPGHPKARLAFNNSGTIAEDYGVGSVTDVGTGEFRVNFDTSFNNGNYTVLSLTTLAQGTLRYISVKETSQLVASCTIISQGTGGGLSDPEGPTFASFSGDLP